MKIFETLREPSKAGVKTTGAGADAKGVCSNGLPLLYDPSEKDMASQGKIRMKLMLGDKCPIRMFCCSDGGGSCPLLLVTLVGFVVDESGCLPHLEGDQASSAKTT